MPADLVLLNGTVITVDDDQPTAEAVAVVGNRIARVGSNDEIRDDVGPTTRVIDL
ncbi:MAG: Amidohydrolase 3, partial [Thermomicrobiales bacterium]|nr:Amidohydrolase 3 [Thermomicrobiales bacterium]